MQTKKTSIFTKEIKFLSAATKPENLQHFTLPEIAFFGKSNVGKSSLINFICARKNLARVSKTPGCTKQINFFSIADDFILADLPGYGFSRVSKSISSQWEKLIVHYLHSRANLNNIILLIDARRNLKDNDFQIIELILQNNRIFDLVFTKVDKITNQELLELKNNTINSVGSYGHIPNIFFTSSKSQQGAEELRRYIQKISAHQ
jgi:GTP-binding protein